MVFAPHIIRDYWSGKTNGDFWLGDIVTVAVDVPTYTEDENGNLSEATETIYVDEVVTEATITYENGARTVDVTFAERPVSYSSVSSSKYALDLLKISGNGIREELGTFLPAFATGTPTYVVQTGHYLRIGSLCYVWGMLQWSTKTGITGAVVQIGGFPFNFKYSGAIFPMSTYNTPFASAGYSPFLYSNSGHKYCDLYAYISNTNGMANVTPAILAADGTITFSGIYQIEE